MFAPSLVMKTGKPNVGKRGDEGRFVTLRSGRVIFIPKGYKSKWADVRDRIKAGRGDGVTVWQSEQGGSIHQVKTGARVSSADLPNEMCTALFDSRDKTWHLSGPGVEHSLFGAEVVRGKKHVAQALSEEEWSLLDVSVIAGWWHPEDKTLVVIDRSEIVYAVESETDPNRARRMANATARSARRALRESFFVDGEKTNMELDFDEWAD